MAEVKEEAKILASLNHPNIIRLVDCQDTVAVDGCIHIVTEYADTGDLYKVCKHTHTHTHTHTRARVQP